MSIFVRSVPKDGSRQTKVRARYGVYGRTHVLSHQESCDFLGDEVKGAPGLHTAQQRTGGSNGY